MIFEGTSIILSVTCEILTKIARQINLVFPKLFHPFTFTVTFHIIQVFHADDVITFLAWLPPVLHCLEVSFKFAKCLSIYWKRFARSEISLQEFYCPLTE